MQEKGIELRAVHGKTQGSLMLSPVKDKITGRLKGVKELSEEERRKEVRPVTAETQRKISDHLFLDIVTSETDRVDWEWIKHCVEISPSLEEAKDNPAALFYIDMPDRFVEISHAKRKKKFEAESLIRNLSEVERNEMAKYLGQNASYMRPIELMDWLISTLDSKGGPDKILNAKSDPKFKTKLFLYSLIDAGKIKKNAEGTYFYGEIILGVNELSAINWLDSPKNQDLVGKLYIELYAGDDAVSDSVIDRFESAAALKKGSVAENKADIAGEAVRGTPKFEEVDTL